MIVWRSNDGLGPLERRLEVEDRADRLTGDHASGGEAATVADAIDLESDRLGVVAAADEIGAQRMHLEIGFDGGRRGPQRLGHDLAAVQSAPRIARSDSDEGVRAVWLEIEQSAGFHCESSVTIGVGRL